ncbi:Yip1 family protein [Sporosarcina obsidiansis]|uniref:Yip1 family protein n=1 Tax=Sporosarcina obsidiansis TaxID=2660748 RepID=UPI001890EFA3|nr:Yip1 family protein [Sporosarcina obsidiansis]
MNPILSIWTKPKQTIQYVLETKTWNYGFFIILVASISIGLTSFADTGFLTNLPLVLIILLGIISSFVGGIIGWFINAGLYTWVGKWLGGTGKFKEMATVVPLSSLPIIWMLPYNLLLVAIYGKTLFQDPYEMGSLTNIPIILFILSNLLLLGLGVFSTVILSKAIGVVHHFSTWRGFGTIMIIVGILLIILIPIMIIIFFSFFLIAI